MKSARARTIDALFHDVYRDAVKQGYRRSERTLRAPFNRRVQSARDLHEALADADAEYGDAALLKAIREIGGLKPFWRDWYGNKLRGDFATIVDGFGADSGWRQRGGASIFRSRGLYADELVQHLHQDPRWVQRIGDMNDLLDALDDIARRGPRRVVTGDLRIYLDATGVRPGERWWLNEPDRAVARVERTPCERCGALSKPRPLPGKTRYKHRCQHGTPCLAGEPPASTYSGCSDCAAAERRAS